MGCNVLLHVALLWGLPPAYITVFGQKPCQQDQRQVECLANDTSPENTCPGVGVYCTSGDKLCGCVGSRYRNNRFKCVKYGDCVERKYDTMALLQAKEAVYLVGVSKHPPHSELPYKCMKLFLKYATSHESHRRMLFEYRRDYEEETNKINENLHDHCIWKRKKLSLTFWLEKGNHTYLRYFVGGPGSPQKRPGTLDIVHATADCLITGTHSYKNRKFDCTLWTRKDLVGRIPEDCDFIFQANCNNAEYILKDLKACSNAYA
ncbi:uncharacterized protein LOC119186866 [Rhipicephalus microplus]|uniref:uncharacterized protein LOC119186866 n=1 Tax=Rhipicephalus microplus TaxID=6941 RepID=UPI003F6B97F8